MEKILVKGKELYAAFMDLEKVYDRVDRDAKSNPKEFFLICIGQKARIE